MGSTGLPTQSKNRPKISDENFGILGGRAYDGITPKDAGLDAHSNKDLQFRVPSSTGKDIIFQFKLVRNGQMSISAFDPSTKERAKIKVSDTRPSLDTVIAEGKLSEKKAAIKMKEMFNKAKNGIKENSLVRIANELKSRRK